MRLFAWQDIKPQSAPEAKQQADSLRLYVERCAATDNNSWQVFLALNSAVQLMSSDSARFDAYRDWLISVLYLNTTNPEYFCVCVASIATTYQAGMYHHIKNASFAVENYLRTYHRECWDSRDSAAYAQDSIYARQQGDDVSHLPSLDSIGLGSLLTHESVGAGGELPPTYFGTISAAPNPFTKEIDLSYTLNRTTYVTVAIYDVLGRIVWGDGRGRSLDAGLHTISIDGSSLPSGTLYARISTGFGEVKTVKLVKQE